jgi:hypothetical protein
MALGGSCIKNARTWPGSGPALARLWLWQLARLWPGSGSGSWPGSGPALARRKKKTARTNP